VTSNGEPKEMIKRVMKAGFAEGTKEQGELRPSFHAAAAAILVS
jgi:hypothetical protein